MKLSDFIPPVAMNMMRSFKQSLTRKERYERGELFTRSVSRILEKNTELIDLHQGKRCFILATGSSIANQDLKPLQHEICIGLNEFFLHPDYSVIRPKYLVFSGFGIHSKIPHEKRIPWYQNFDSITSNTSTPIINISDHDLISGQKLLSADHVYYMQYRHQLSEVEKKGLHPVKQMYSSASVSVMALQIALVMGFKEIVLVGFDHDWLWRMFDNQPTHFYDHNKSIIYKGISEVKGISVISELQSTLNLFQNYELLKQYADAKSVRVFNATHGGTLDVFPRVQLDSFYRKS